MEPFRDISAFCAIIELVYSEHMKKKKKMEYLNILATTKYFYNIVARKKDCNDSQAIKRPGHQLKTLKVKAAKKKI